MNHSFEPNAHYDAIDHPRFGVIASVVSLKPIKKGEEILCNYLEFIGSASHWAEDIRGLQGQCAGTEVGEISAYELDELPKIAATAAAADTQEVLITDMINWLTHNEEL